MEGFDIRPGETPPSYLDHPSFHQKHDGPRMHGPNRVLLQTREPSRQQIRAMRRAIRKTWNLAERRGRRAGPPDATTPSERQLAARAAAMRAVLASKALRQEIGPPDAIVAERSGAHTTPEPSDG